MFINKSEVFLEKHSQKSGWASMLLGHAIFTTYEFPFRAGYGMYLVPLELCGLFYPRYYH
ncbi:hypothetical protein [Echinicola vietnamensis]|uniref:Uncharacterized protein n=1 Tax=Echinicola vietnamensis (strain DSM 17526 / LMG 23754 / KMM 6221) TaxID=926556 RepID=L0FXR8_ECHVK|nr:hypothetical protein [Echinicola vietnamensis]AGA78709.1 hypothetical protein Echvi_2462 [Echinicola vietnamensis DSM 17526]